MLQLGHSRVPTRAETDIVQMNRWIQPLYLAGSHAAEAGSMLAPSSAAAVAKGKAKLLIGVSPDYRRRSFAGLPPVQFASIRVRCHHSSRDDDSRARVVKRTAPRDFGISDAS